MGLHSNGSVPRMIYIVKNDWLIEIKIIVKQCKFLPDWVHASCIEPEILFILEKIAVKTRNSCHIYVIRSTCRWQCDLDTSSPGSVAVTFLRPHLFQVTFDIPQVLDFGLQGFNLHTRGTNTQPHKAHYTLQATNNLWNGFYGLELTRKRMTHHLSRPQLEQTPTNCEAQTRWRLCHFHII